MSNHFLLKPSMTYGKQVHIFSVCWLYLNLRASVVKSLMFIWSHIFLKVGIMTSSLSRCQFFIAYQPLQNGVTFLVRGASSSPNFQIHWYQGFPLYSYVRPTRNTVRRWWRERLQTRLALSSWLTVPKSWVRWLERVKVIWGMEWTEGAGQMLWSWMLPTEPTVLTPPCDGSVISIVRWHRYPWP